ncbi:MAG: dITP/XTP pyrophosphatase [Promethearchaeota archaeon]|nr:MAG: dITP/XTP pyrophosphatase [Candidatus Lokiarchaeota archaeon]
MNKKRILYFITGNIHKFEEVSERIKRENINFEVKHANLKTREIQAESLEEVAEFKLKSVKEKVAGSYFIEDAGFFIDSPLNGFPGVYSSYIFKTVGNENILKMIDDFNSTKAHFSAVIALYFKPLDKVYFFKGRVDGKVSPSAKGTFGFGYDPIFIPHEYPTKTFGELSTEGKNKISHRARALEKLIRFLKKETP